MFASEKSVSMVTPILKESKSTVDFEKEKAMLNNPEGMFKILAFQNERLIKLQEQVHQQNEQLMRLQEQQVHQIQVCQRNSEHETSYMSSQRY